MSLNIYYENQLLMNSLPPFLRDIILSYHIFSYLIISYLIQQITVFVVGDDTPEPDETFSVLLSSPTNATIASNSAVATIYNDDGIPTIRIANTTVIEADTNDNNAVFNVTLVPSSDIVVTLKYTTMEVIIDYIYSLLLWMIF